MRALCLMLLCSARLTWAAEAPHHHHVAQEPLPADKATEASLYDLKIGLVDANGAKLKLEAFRGKPVLISMFYGTCTSACPMLVAKVKRIESKLSARAKAVARVVLVSFDPTRDTPEALHKLAVSYQADARWTLAQTPPDSVRELAAALGIRYRFLGDGTLNHSSVLTLLGPDGNVLVRIDGLDTPDDALVQKLEAFAAAQPAL